MITATQTVLLLWSTTALLYTWAWCYGNYQADALSYRLERAMDLAAVYSRGRSVSVRNAAEMRAYIRSLPTPVMARIPSLTSPGAEFFARKVHGLGLRTVAEVAPTVAVHRIQKVA